MNIETALKMLNSTEAYDVSFNVEVAKGKFAIPRTLSQGIKQIMREIRFRKNGR